MLILPPSSKLSITKKTSAGFTLIELIIVIVLVGFLAAMTTDIITLPVKSYLDLERRTRLVDNAEMALRRMQRDIRSALPNSLRITHPGITHPGITHDEIINDGITLELLHTTDGGRYRAKLDPCTLPCNQGDILEFNSTDTRFDVLSTLHSDPSGYLVIYNLGSSGANAYAHDNLAPITASTILPLPTTIDFSRDKKFPFQSPEQRFFIVDTPISYRCIGGELRRYSKYDISDPSPLPDPFPSSPPDPTTYSIQAKASTLSCAFTYDPGSATRAGLVTLKIELTDKAGEKAKLIHQVHVDNMP